MLKYPTLSLGDEERSRLELLLVSGQSTRGSLKQGPSRNYVVSVEGRYLKDNLVILPHLLSNKDDKKGEGVKNYRV